MKNRLFILLILIGISRISFSQKSTFIGVEGAITSDLYLIQDPCNLITTHPIVTGYLGITIGQEINKNFLFETGLIRKAYDHGYGFTTESIVTGSGGSGFNAWQIPFRFKARLNLVKKKFFLTSTVGFHFCINSDYGYGGGSGGGGLVDGNDTIRVSYTVNNSITKTFPLIEAGLGLEFNVYKGLFIYISSSYYSGLKKVYQLDLKTEGYGCITDNATAVSKGSYWNIAFGIKYAISNLWKRKE